MKMGQGHGIRGHCRVVLACLRVCLSYHFSGVLVDAWEVDAGHKADPGGQVRVLLPTVHSQLVQPVVEHRLTSQRNRGEVMRRQGEGERHSKVSMYQAGTTWAQGCEETRVHQEGSSCCVCLCVSYIYLIIDIHMRL